MASENILYAGTVGQGVWRSLDDGETFHRHCSGMFMEAQVRALAVDPQSPDYLYAGTDAGIYRTQDGGERWERLQTPFDSGNGWPSGTAVWSLLLHPRKQNLILAGTCPSGIYRSTDMGMTWTMAEAALTPECPPIKFSRVTCLMADPLDDATLWAGVEIDGVWRSRDYGVSWERMTTGLSSLDIHSLLILPGNPCTVIAATNNDLNISRDEGKTWAPQHVKEFFPHSYCRGSAMKEDDPTFLLVGNGNGPPGTTGSLQLSRDGGRSWRKASLPVAPNSTIWTFATHAGNPSLIFCASINGDLFRSRDGAESWEKCGHEFGELRSLALVVK